MPCAFLLFKKQETSVVLSACGESEDGSGGVDSRVLISTGDDILVLNAEVYQLPYVVQVADLNGTAQPDTTVSISVVTTQNQPG